MEKSLEAKVAQNATNIKNLGKRVDKLEPIVETIHEIAVSIARMTTIQEKMVEEQKAQREDIKQMNADINAIKERPSKDAHQIKMAVVSCVITTVIGAIIGAILALILK